MKIYGLVEKIKAFIGNWQSAAPTLASGESSVYFDADGDPRVVVGAAEADTDLAIPTSTQKTSFSASGAVNLTLPISGTVETTSGSASAASSAVSSHSGLATGVHGVGTGDVVGTDKVQALTEKYLNGGTANSNNKWKVPQDTLANIQLLTPTEGLIVYATDVDTVYVGDGSSWLPVGSGSGQGEKNYIENPSAATATTGWSVSSANITIARTTTAANCPREFTTGTALSFTSSTDEAYGYYRFSLDDCDLSKKLKLVLSFINADTSDAWRVEMWKNSASNYSGTYTELSLSTDSSGDSYLPVTTGDYKTTFDTDTIAYLELRVVHNGTNSDVLYVSDVVVGPGSVVTGAVVEEWKSYTPTGSWTTNTTYTGKYRRVGDSMEVDATMLLTSTAPASGDLSINLPSGYTIDTTKLSNFAAVRYPVLGSAIISDQSFVRDYVGSVVYSSTTAVKIVHSESGNVGIVSNTQPIAFDTADSVSVRFMVPIAEWAGSGTVNLAQNDVEYAYCTDTTNADSTSSANFGYGPVGALFPNRTVGTAVSKRVGFQTLIQSTDDISIQWQDPATLEWSPGEGVGAFLGASGGAHGMRTFPTAGTTNQLDVQFGKYGYSVAGGLGSNGDGWDSLYSGGYKWRVRKVSAGAAVGVGMATTDSAGLVKKNYLYRAAATGRYTSTDNGSIVLSKSIPAGTYRFTLSGHLNGPITTNCAATMYKDGSLFYPLGGSDFENRAHLALITTAENRSSQTLTFIYTVLSTSTFDFRLSLNGGAGIGNLSWTAESLENATIF